jgi:ubiquinone/menaquinone biosynthesis C-methylase UbiE
LTQPDEDVERWSGLRAFFYSLIAWRSKSNAAVVAHAGVGPGDLVLDIGCGSGVSLDLAQKEGAVVYGVDPSPAMVARAARRVPQAILREGSAENLEFADGQFTHVWTISSYHHWADTGRGIAEAFRVLGDSGTLYIVESKLKARKHGHGLNPTDAELLAKDLADAGFQDCRIDEISAGRSEYLVVSGTVLP